MGNQRGAKCKLCRREGEKLFLKGMRCLMAKCPVETGRPPPGVHGQRRSRKMSDYGVQLREKQKLRRQYGLQEGQFRLFFERVAKRRGVTGEQLLQMLESRLDNVVYRLGFAGSRKEARQMVVHNHVQVNARKATVPSMILEPGAVVQVKDRSSSRALAGRNLEAAQGRELAPWLSRDDAAFTGEFLRVPSREEIAPVVNEQLIVELYSK
ncbi:MAG: 30S ribosomal protein S4 [Lentisphaerae bacterium]|nr:30S ribosomal protein S4 [Lentisphaerota bacterium]